jgi:5'-3' exonuclease
MDEYRKEIEEYFPFKSLKIKNCEADDIIGVLCLNLDRRFHIISTDNDFLQLSSPNITIYNPIKKEEIAHPDPEMFLRELSLMGQRKDNIPNVKTPLD